MGQRCGIFRYTHRHLPAFEFPRPSFTELIFLGWALFVVGHDAGHGSFSENWWYNQVCGHLCHTPILVPFNGWQISHYKHHRFHNHINKDESWKPMKKSYFENMDWIAKYVFRKTPLVLVMYPWYVCISFFAFPSWSCVLWVRYLLGIPDSPLLSGSHFDPFSRLFSDSNRLRASVSSVAVISWLGIHPSFFFLVKSLSDDFTVLISDFFSFSPTFLTHS